LDISTGPSPCSTPVATEISELIAVTGMCPLNAAPEAFSANSSGSSRRRADSVGRSAAANTPSMTRFGLTANSTGSSPAARVASMETMESLPPPTFTSGRWWAGAAGGVGSVCAARSGCSSRTCGRLLR
jgi:hypothetical protein